jgi:hypothetical protein
MNTMKWAKSHWIISSFVCLSLIFTAVFYVNPPNAYALGEPQVAQAENQVAQVGGLGGSSGSEVSSCSLEQIGWLACPIVRSVAKIADSAWTFVTNDFLVVDVQFFDDSSTASTVWGAMRNIANVLFVMAFLVVVYSLLTSTGINNYDLKRLVPRLLVAAILVNISFYVCQLMVDVATVAGATILDLIKGILGEGTVTGMPMDQAREDVQVLGEITAATLANNEVAWILLAPIVAVVFSAAILCSVILVILILRKVLVVALILVSPLAFVAYLLPNTEQYFSKWLKLFTHLLLIFPIVSILLGTGQIVSAAIIKAEDSQQADGYKQDGDEYNTTNGGGNKSATLRLIAAGAAILPLAGTWYAFKGMTALMDSAGVRIAQGRRGRGHQGSSDDAAKREAAFDLNKNSKMMNGFNKIQQITAMQDGGANASFIRSIGGRRGFKKSAKSAAQSDFDSKVQQRLGELRSGASGSSPQQAYMQALQRYQDKQADVGSGLGSDGSLNINSYEGIDLKASEAYLLESLGKGGSSSTLNNTSVVAAQAGGGGTGSDGNSSNDKSGNSSNKKDDKDEKKSAGLSSLNRDGKGGGGGGGGSSEPQDSYRPPSNGDKAAALNSALGGVAGSTAATSNSASAGGGGAQTIIIQSNGGGGGAAPEAAGSFAERRSASRVRPMAMTDSELKAKARAAKYVAGSQDSLFDKTGTDLSSPTLSEDTVNSFPEPDLNQLDLHDDNSRKQD